MLIIFLVSLLFQSGNFIAFVFSLRLERFSFVEFVTEYLIFIACELSLLSDFLLIKFFIEIDFEMSVGFFFLLRERLLLFFVVC